MITRTFKLCLNAGTGSAPYINVSQYDEGETWLFELYSETGERYIPTTGAIVGVKSDGHGIANTGTVDSEGRVVIAETQQMTASAGRAIYELSIDGLTHGTANFIVAVERKPTDDAVMSDSDLSLIQEAIDAAEVINEVIGEGGDPSELITENVNNWLDTHPEATTTVQDGAITAPKINSTLWDKLLVSEEASGNPASFEDGADDVPVSSLKVNLEPIQNLNGYDYPWIGGGGKNLLNWEKVNVSSTANYGMTFTKDSGEGEITISGTLTFSGGSVAPIWYDDYSLSGKNYVFLTEHISGDTLVTLNRTYGLRTESEKSIAVYMTGTAGQSYSETIRISVYESPVPTDWTPYENICPIYPANGKNLFETKNVGRTNNGVTYALQNGELVLTGTASSISFLFGAVTYNMLTKIPAGTYMLSGGHSANIMTVATTYTVGSAPDYAVTKIADVASDTGHGATFTLNEDSWMCVNVRVQSGEVTNTTVQIQIERGSATSYQPYQGIMVKRTGKNILPNDLTWTTGVRDDYGNHSSSAVSHYSSMFRVAPSTTYTAQGLYIDATSWRLYFLDENGNWISRTASSASAINSFTTPANCYYMQVQVGLNGTLTSGAQIELGTEATEYEPFISTTYPYTLGQSVYGGTVDLATGVLTVAWVTVDMGNLNWSASSTTHCFYANFGTYPQYKIGSNVQFVCTQYKYDGTRNASPYFGDNGTLRAYGRANASSPSEIYVRDDRYTAVADFKTAVTGQTICCELATPTTVQLTPQEVKTLLGYNNISSSGTVDVIYHADTKLYVDKMTAVDNNIIAPTEADFVATRNYTVNDLVIVNDTLYKVTANIANGGTITPNSNVTQTTLSALIKALS